MKTKIILLVALVSTIGFASCKKCLTCKYTYQSYSGGIWNTHSYIEEYCGSDWQIKNAEEGFIEKANSEKRIIKEPTCNLS